VRTARVQFFISVFPFSGLCIELWTSKGEVSGFADDTSLSIVGECEETIINPIVFYIGIARQMPVVMVSKYWFQTFSMLDINHHITFQMPVQLQQVPVN